MNPGQHPETLDRLAARHALGLMRGGSRRRFEQHARRSATVRAAIWLWHERLAAMTELVAPVPPDARVWRAIEAQLDREAPAAAPARPHPLEAFVERLRVSAQRWRMATLAAGAVAVLAAVGVVQQTAELRRQPRLDSVAVLADDRSQATFVVTVDRANGRIGVRRAADYREAADKSLQLWALPAAGLPRSLGVLAEEPLDRLQLDARAIDAVNAIAVSLEPKGGVSGQSGPSGPVLFKGALLPASL